MLRISSNVISGASNTCSKADLNTFFSFYLNYALTKMFTIKL